MSVVGYWGRCILTKWCSAFIEAENRAMEELAFRAGSYYLIFRVLAPSGVTCAVAKSKMLFAGSIGAGAVQMLDSRFR